MGGEARRGEWRISHLLRVIGVGVFVTLSWGAVALADEGDFEVVVEGAPVSEFGRSTLASSDISLSPVHDSAEALLTVPGVSGGRAGGHGLEPVIRGQQQGQLNVLDSGSFTFGGCPNRMDPPTSSSHFGPGREVRVERGYHTVTHGPGGAGGTILFERVAPRYDAERPFRALGVGSLETNGERYDLLSEVSEVDERRYVTARGFWTNAGNYSDGGGSTVRSAFESFGGGLDVGLGSPEASSLEFFFDYVGLRDVLYEGLSMDSPYTDTYRYIVRGTIDLDEGILSRVRSEVYLSLVDHEMNNYSLRERSSMFMRTPSESTTYGGRVVAELDLGAIPLSLGSDILVNDRSAVRRASMMTREDVAAVQSYLWPDAALTTVGIFAEAPIPVSDEFRLTFGVRYDLHHAEAHDRDGKADLSVGGAAPVSSRDLYERYYGKDGAPSTEHNLGGLMRAEYEITPRTTLFGGASRVIRSADATERFMASNQGPDSWIGNPGIAPEVHHQIEIGTRSVRERGSTELVAYSDWVSDYIFRDRARMQEGILRGDGATIYRSIDALLAGVELSGRYKLTTSLTVHGSLSYSYGENQDSNDPLPQIPPLGGEAGLEWSRESWRLGSRVRFAGTQPRVDTDPLTGSGRDVRSTPGWGIADLYSAVEIASGLTLRLGATNILDKKFSYHLSRSAPFDPEEVQVNEPGRSFFIEVRGEI